MNYVHEGISDYCNCDQCNYKAKRQRYLKAHVESWHDSVCHSCSQCDYKALFNSMINLCMKVYVIPVNSVTLKQRQNIISSNI